MDADSSLGPLGRSDVERFVEEGFVRIDGAFSREVADAAREILWRDTGCAPDDPTTWRRPVVRLGHYVQPPFSAVGDSPLLRGAFDQLVGPGNWLPPRAIGTFVVRFPSADEPGDTGWHVDVSFGTDTPDFLEWRANVHSRGRALLMLLLFSDTGEDDAPTRIRVGSHLEIARRLHPAGDAGLTLRELAANGFGETAALPEVAATGPAGTAYLCHPFLVHAGQPNRRGGPRFLAQPPLLPARPLRFDDPGSPAPVMRAIRRAVGSRDGG